MTAHYVAVGRGLFKVVAGAGEVWGGQWSQTPCWGITYLCIFPSSPLQIAINLVFYFLFQLFRICFSDSSKLRVVSILTEFLDTKAIQLSYSNTMRKIKNKKAISIF